MINPLTVADNGNKLRLIFWIIDILISICRFPSLSARILEPLGIYFKKIIIFQM